MIRLFTAGRVRHLAGWQQGLTKLGDARRFDMIKRTTVSMTAIVVFLAMVFVVPARAQPSAGPTWQDSVSQHHRMIYQMMKDMNDQMGQMTEQMSRGELTPEQRKQMADRMGLMSTLMRRMSGLEARPAMKPAEWQRQMDGMRKQMDGMMRDSPMTPSAK